MFEHRSMLATLALITATLTPVGAQAPAGVNAGVLNCELAPSIGLIIGSHQSMTCRFNRSGPFPPEIYVGAINTIGLDIGITAGGALAWAVFAPTEGPPVGALAGTYVGASGEIGLGVGVGANALFGGSARSIALQPLSVSGEVGVNLALGISGLELRLAP